MKPSSPRVRLAALAGAMLLGVGTVGGGRTVHLVQGAAPSGRVFYAAPDARREGVGTRDDPFDLAFAMSGRSPVAPGDTIWLRGGTYEGAFTSELSGTPTAPIVVRQYPGEHAILDSTTSTASALFVRGKYAWYWGFEIRNGEPHRTSTAPLAADVTRGAGVTSHAPGAKFINLVIHDMKIGMEVWSSSPDSETYGNLIFNNGYAAADRGHGHGIYTQNRDGHMYFTDNILFGGFSHGIHAYGSSAAYLDHFHIEGNIVFNSGILSPVFERNILVGGGRSATNPVVDRNYTYFGPERRGGENNFGFSAGCTQLEARFNYWAHPAQYPLVIGNSCDGDVHGNVLIGAVSDETMARFPNNTYLRDLSGRVDVFLRPNRYERGRANIVVYNWASRPDVEVSVADAGLTVGQAFTVRDVQNWFGAPVLSGTVPRTLRLSLPMDLKTTTRPIGDVPYVPPHTGRQFGVFVLLPGK